MNIEQSPRLWAWCCGRRRPTMHHNWLIAETEKSHINRLDKSDFINSIWANHRRNQSQLIFSFEGKRTRENRNEFHSTNECGDVAEGSRWFIYRSSIIYSSLTVDSLHLCRHNRLFAVIINEKQIRTARYSLCRPLVNTSRSWVEPFYDPVRTKCQLCHFWARAAWR